MCSMIFIKSKGRKEYYWRKGLSRAKFSKVKGTLVTKKDGRWGVSSDDVRFPSKAHL